MRLLTKPLLLLAKKGRGILAQVKWQKRISLFIDEVCPCCGFSTVKGQDLNLLCNTNDLQFLGSGFPLFFNYIRYCILLLSIEFAIKGAYNLYTNWLGSYCL